MPYQHETMARAKILICEDELLFTEDMSTTLGEFGYEISGLAVTGEEAVRAAEEVRPDLILMDINLPGKIDGIEAAEQIRTHLDIPVVYLTAYSETDVFERAKQTEPYGYVSKPVRFVELTSTIETALYKHEADRKVRESEARRAKAEQLAGLHSWEWDIRTGRLIWSTEAYRTFGLRPEEAELTFDTIFNSVHARDRDAVRQAFSDALDGKRPYDIEFRIVQTNGQERVLHSRGEIQRDANGQAIRMQGMSLDITDCKKSENALRESEERYRALFEGAAEGILVADVETRKLRFANPALCKMFGYTTEEIVQLNVSDIHPAAFIEHVIAHFDAIAGNENSLAPNIPCVRKDGSVFYADIVGTAVAMEGRKMNVGFFTEVTDRKKTEYALRESENRFRMIAEAVTDVLWMTDAETNTTFYTSPAYERVWGRSLDSLYENPRSFIDAIHEEDRCRVVAALEDKKICRTFQQEYRIVRPDGEIRWILDRGFPVQDENGKVTRYVGIARDITEIKNTEEALRESEAKYRGFFSTSRDCVFITSPDGRWIDFNESAIELFGYDSREALFDVPIPQLYANTEDREALLDLIQQQGFVKEHPVKLKRKSGEVFDSLITTSCLRGANGSVREFAGTIRDITELKKAQEALRAAEERYRSIVEESFDGIFLQKGTKIVFANSRLCELLGCERSELEGLEHWLIYHPDYHDITHSRAEARMRGEAVPSQYEVMLQRKDGSSFHGEILAKAVEVGGEPGVQVWVRDTTAQREAEQELRRSEERYRTLFEESKDGIFLTADDGRVLDANQSLLDMLGYTLDELLGLNIVEVYVDPSDREKYRRAIKKTGSVKDYPIRFRKKDGGEIHCLETASVRLGPDGAIVGYQGIIRDVSEQEHLQEQLLQAQKMEAVGTLAGGVAHDFNNILQVALGYSELILGDEDLPQRFKPDLQKINESVRRGADLVQRLLTFSRKTPSNPQPLSINHRINEIGKMLKRTIPRMIDIQLVLGEDLAAINADPTQVDQVLMNLAVNSRDAMPDGGKLVIETANVLLDEQYARKHLEAKPGHYVLLMVTDTGSGMDKDTLEHIFEPFYTTKEAGQGTGLGLAVVHGIVQQHGGFIRCYSEPGAGTTFKVYFPALFSDRESEDRVAGLWPRGGSETILVADDDEMIRDLCSRILTKAGYTVITASNGKEVLEVYATQAESISLVILDLIMPEMSGKQCLDGLLSLNPSVKVVIASGYSANGPTQDALSTGAKGFVNKPYEIRQVLEVVRRVLDSK